MAGFSGETAVKYEEAKAGAEAGYKRAKKYGLKMAWGTDTFGPLDIQKHQKDEWVARAKYFTPYEILVQATLLNAEPLERAGKRHPYQQGPLGVIEPGPTRTSSSWTATRSRTSHCSATPRRISS